MSPKKPFEPNFHTPDDKLCKEELNKLNKDQVYNQIKDEFRNQIPDLTWEGEQLAKTQGIYLEFDRSLRDADKHWIYMIRISIPGGGPISREQWNLFDQLSEKYSKDPEGNSSIRLTNRQNVQFHWVEKQGVIDIIKTLAEKDMRSLNGCGDNTRNVMAPPLARFSKIFNAVDWAHKTGAYFQLPMDPFMKIFAIDPTKVRKPGESFEYGPKLLNRKFKIAYAGLMTDKNGKIIPDNSAEMLTNDLGISPIYENGKVTRVQIYVGGGQGERNGKPTTAALSVPLCITTTDKLMKTLDAVVKVHQEWGDRENRHWARLKYVIKKQGAVWYREQVQKLLDFPLQDPNPNHNPGARQLYYGWNKQETNGLWAYGMFVENGRLTDTSPNGKLKTLVRELVNKYPYDLMITPNQDLLWCNIPEDKKSEFENELKKYGWGKRNGKEYSTLRLLSGACVGLNTCRLSYTESERFEPILIDQLEALGWGNMYESIGITGCERQCFRPGTKTIGLVGSGSDRYMFKLMGDETGLHQGKPLLSPDGEKMYLRSVAREAVPVVIDALFKFYQKNKQPNEGLGAYHRRIGQEAIINHLKENPATTALMEKPFPTNDILE